jgi:hypothetical protein
MLRADLRPLGRQVGRAYARHAKSQITGPSNSATGPHLTALFGPSRSRRFQFLADTLALEASAQKAWGFKSLREHQRFLL